MKLTISPAQNSTKTKSQVVDLKKFLQKQGIKTEVIEKAPKKGELGRGIVSGLSTILTGGETLFSRLGEALVKYVEGRRVDLTMKNTKGEELVLSAAIPKSEIKSLINEFFQRQISVDTKSKTRNTRNTAKKTTATKKTASKSRVPKNVTNAKKTTSVKTKPTLNKSSSKKTTKGK